jgi:hypothetical protein
VFSTSERLCIIEGAELEQCVGDASGPRRRVVEQQKVTPPS